MALYSKFSHESKFLGEKQEGLGRISSGHIIPFGDRQDIILIHGELSNPTVCKFIVNRMILLYQDYFD